MTRLLVSVRSAVEARQALDGGADLIDVKEPSRGSLGAADLRQIQEVIDAVDGLAPVSVALGELHDWPSRRLSPPAGIRFAKLGLSRCSGQPNWRQQWSDALTSLPEGASPVAVVYADWPMAGSPSPEQTLAQAQRLGCPALLIDTFDKRQGDLLVHWPLDRLSPFVAAVRDAGLLTVLAGSLSTATIARLLPLRPDYIAVRGAVCIGSRDGTVEADLVRRLADLLQADSLSRYSG